MKRTLPVLPQTSMRFLALVCLFTPLLLNGQINYFAPVGSTWYYDHTFFFGNNKNDYTKILTIGDTVFDGKSCSVLFIENADINLSGIPDSVYLRFDGGKVYRYFEEQEIWGLQYDFNADIGDTLVCYGNYYEIFDSFKVRVDSVGIININNVFLKTQHYRSLSVFWEITQKIIEGVGGEQFLFTTYTLSENTNLGLRCYEDDSIGHYNSGLVEICDTIFYVGIDESVILEKIKISPTLLNNELSITNSTGGQLQFYLFDIASNMVMQAEIAPYETKVISCSMLHSGFYLAKVSSPYGIKLTRIIKP
jgi:hypothetical protein